MHGSWDWSSVTEYLGAVYGTGEAATHPAVTAGASATATMNGLKTYIEGACLGDIKVTIVL